MKNRITKLAIPAVILAGAVFGVLVLMHDWSRISPVLEQILDACRKKQRVHFTFVQGDELRKAAWVEYDKDGRLARMRVDLEIVNNEPGQAIVWQGGHTKCWKVSEKELLLFDDEDYSARILHFVHRNDPRQAVEYIQKMERKGDVEIAIEQPSDLSMPVVMTVNYKPNTYLLDAAYPPMREVMFVDHTTKLITTVEVWGPGKDFGLKGDELALLGAYRYDGYDEPFGDRIFDLEGEAGKDVNIIDMKTVDIGMEFAEPELTEEQMAVATVRAFFKSLIAKDYNEAARLLGHTAEKRPQVREALEKMNINVVDIVWIGEPHSPSRGWGHMIVPCTVAVEINGQRVEKKLEEVSVNRVLGHPDRRTVGFDWSILVGN